MLPDPMRSVFCGYFAVLGVALCLLSGATEMDYVGVSDCESCHQEQAKKWRDSPHAKATLTLGERATETACRTCHATGLAPLGQSPLPGVQCEACHGAGRGYRDEDIMRNPLLAEILGLVDLSSKEARRNLCLGCHQAGAKITPFAVEAKWQEIAH